MLGLADDPSFRTTDAYAKGGHERYAAGPGVEAELEAALSEASGPPGEAIWRAARVYLDVCFYHPFDDGNARAARLALDYVLTRAGLAMIVADPMFAFSRWADDIFGAFSFAVMLEWVSGHFPGAAGSPRLPQGASPLPRSRR